MSLSNKAKEALRRAMTENESAEELRLSMDIQKLESDAGSGGAASETMTVDGLNSDDEILAITQKTAGANGTAMVAYSNQADDALDITWTADPGAGAIVEVLVRRTSNKVKLA